jgi:hypothetical protein
MPEILLPSGWVVNEESGCVAASYQIFFAASGIRRAKGQGTQRRVFPVAHPIPPTNTAELRAKLQEAETQVKKYEALVKENEQLKAVMAEKDYTRTKKSMEQAFQCVLLWSTCRA